MKKFLSLFAAILFAGTLMAGVSSMVFTGKCKGTGTADDGAVWAVTADVDESNGSQAQGIHYGTASAEVSYVQLVTSDISGTISKIVVCGEDDADSEEDKATVSVTVGSTAFTGENTKLTADQAEYTFTGNASGEIKVRIERPNKAKKAIWVKSVIVTYDDGVPSIDAKKIDFKAVIVSALPFEKDTFVTVTTSSLSADIAVTVDGSHVTVPSSLAKEGGKLDVKISATAEGSFSDTIILTSGTAEAKIAVEATIAKVTGEGTEENPFTVEDVIKINNGLGTEKYWVKGFIVGCAGNNGTIKSEADSASIALGMAASETEGVIPVELSKSSSGYEKVRNDLNVYGTQASNIGKEVRVYGKLEAYKGFTGIKSVNKYEWLGEAARVKDVSIKLLKINGAAVAADKKVYEYTVSAEEDLAQVEVVFELGNAGAKADKASGFKVDVPASSTDPATEVKLTITSEDETVTAEYTIKVSRAAADAPKSSDATLKEVKINNEVVAEKNGVFAYKVAADVNLAQVEVSFICNEAHATADKENPFKVDVPADSEAPATEVIIKITAEDKATTKEYKISVSRAAQGETPGPDDPDEPDDQGLDQVNALNNARKILVNGMLIIEHNGVRYNIHGQQIQ